MNTKRNDGGPAFPLATSSLSNDSYCVNGMSLRDWFAGQAISPMLVQAYGNTPEFLASHAYAIADAMLKAREK